jgi:hypothetical protein
MEQGSKMGPIGPEQIASIPSIFKHVITDPKGFFEDMPIRGGFVDPFVFLIAMGIGVGVIQAIVSLIGLGPDSSVSTALFSLILIPIVFTFLAFVITFILYCIWNVMGSREPFETAFRCGAFSAAIAPAAAVLWLIPYAGGILSLAWLAYLLIVASLEVHHIEPKVAWIVFGGIWLVFAVAVVRL